MDVTDPCPFYMRRGGLKIFCQQSVDKDMKDKDMKFRFLLINE